jgi:hypothetical protein
MIFMGYTSTLNLGGKKISTEYNSHSIHITNDSELKGYLLQWGHGAREVTKGSKANFKYYYGRSFGVTDDSMTLEILGHIYPEVILTALQIGTIYIPGASLLIELLKKLVNSRTDVIDIGESGYDSNRGIWDKFQNYVGVVEALVID